MCNKYTQVNWRYRPADRVHTVVVLAVTVSCTHVDVAHSVTVAEHVRSFNCVITEWKVASLSATDVTRFGHVQAAALREDRAIPLVA